MRYYVDTRVGCIAVRDSRAENIDDQGLHSDTRGVLHYFGGECVLGEWNVSEALREKAKKICDELNLKEEEECACSNIERTKLKDVPYMVGAEVTHVCLELTFCKDCGKPSEVGLWK